MVVTTVRGGKLHVSDVTIEQIIHLHIPGPLTRLRRWAYSSCLITQM